MYARECQKLKQMGAITGQPDWTLMVQSYDGKWHTLNLEFKRPGNGTAQYYGSRRWLRPENENSLTLKI